MKKHLFFAACLLLASRPAFSQESYLVPPSSSTYGSVPTISDEQMEQCIRVYTRIERTKYSRDMSTEIDWFNRNCAGKQSYSACQKANEMNRQQGLPEQPCR